MYNQEGTTMEEQKSKQSIPTYVMEIYAKSERLTVEPYTGDKDCGQYITVDKAIEICDKAVKASNQVQAAVKPACEFTQEHFSVVGRAIEKWIKQDLVIEGKDMIGKKEGAKTLRERINEELSKSV